MVTKSVEYGYDPWNNLVWRSVDADGAGAGAAVKTYFVNDGTEAVLALSPTGAVKDRYLWAPTVDQVLADEQPGTGDLLWTFTDNLGTVRELARYTGGVTSVANHRVFDSYGQLKSETNAAVDHLFAFTGRMLDEDTGLQQHLNRWYDPKVGRWLSEDPIGFEAGDVNVYRYVGNSPPTETDPRGLQAGAGTISSGQLAYAASKCKVECGLCNPWKSTKIVCEKVTSFFFWEGCTSREENILVDQMHRIYQEANQFATAAIKELGAADTERNHAALRHCYASGKYAKLLGAGCAACLGHYREEYQLLHEGQSLETTRRVDWNNSMGRACAGAFGVGNTFGFGYSGPASDDKIREGCKQKFKDGYLDLGGDTGPRRPGEPLTPSQEYPAPFPLPPQ